MRDDVLSYGYIDIVSPITLAAMEDLGFYVANYALAGCMSWGGQRGAQVHCRCRLGRQLGDDTCESQGVVTGCFSISGSRTRIWNSTQGDCANRNAGGVPH